MSWLLGKPLSSRFNRLPVNRSPGLEKDLSQDREASFVPNQAMLNHRLEPEATPYVELGQASVAGYVSVVLPIYNECACIHATFDAVLDYTECHPFYHFIFVNDGSADETAQILEGRITASQTFQIKLISYPQRRGKGYAVKQGMEFAGGDYICFLDGDLAYSLDHLEQLFEQLSKFDVVIGCRNLVLGGPKGVRPIRKLAGKVFNLCSQWILGLKYNDMQAGLKGFRKQAARELFRKQRLAGFSFDVELIYLAKKMGYQIGEIPARVSLAHGKKASKVKLIQDSLR
ncbi:MAG: glycosyltransferase, partial [Kovacikia sp.]